MFLVARPPEGPYVICKRIVTTTFRNTIIGVAGTLITAEWEFAVRLPG